MIKQADFNPEQWNYVASLLHYTPASEEWADFAEQLLNDLDAEFSAGGQYIDTMSPDQARELANPTGRYATRGTCDHCGAHFNYGAVFKDCGGNHIIVGNTCAFKNLNLTEQQYGDKRMRRRVAAARKAAKTRKLHAANEAKIAELPVAVQEALAYSNPFCQSIRSNFIQWGSLTERQTEALLKVHKTSMERDAKNADILANRVPVPDTGERIMFTGEIVGTKEVEDHYSYNGGTITKLIIMDDRGFKMYGGLPSKVCSDYQVVDTLRGVRLEFYATVQRSKDDEYFGFYKRPTKVKVLNRDPR